MNDIDVPGTYQEALMRCVATLREAEAGRDKLRAQRDLYAQRLAALYEVLGPFGEARSWLEDMEPTARKFVAERDKMRAVMVRLPRYLRHLPDCDAAGQQTRPTRCSCGRRELEQEIDACAAARREEGK